MRAKTKAAPAVPEATEEPILRQLDQWWFGFGSPTSLGLFRILLATIVFLNLVMLLGDWGAWFGENGFVPAWMGQAVLGKTVPIGYGLPELTRLSLIGGVTDPHLAIAFFAFTMLMALTTALGLFTRASSFLLAVCLVSLHHRDSSILHGGDTVMRVMAIYLAVSPSGRACSLDRLFRLRRGEEEGPVEAPVYGQRLVQFNTGLIYFTTIWAKWFGPKWLNGTATWYPARLAEFARFPVPRFANDFPLVYLTTYGTMATEFSLATLVFFRPIRKYVLLAGVMLHGFIEYAMNIPLFSFLMVSCYVCHFEGEEVADYCRRLGDRLRPLMGLEVSLPAGLRLTASGERFLHAVDPFGFVRYLPSARAGGGEGGWEAKKDNGKPAIPFRGVAYRAPGAWPLLIVPTLWRRMVLSSVEAA